MRVVTLAPTTSTIAATASPTRRRIRATPTQTARHSATPPTLTYVIQSVTFIAAVAELPTACIMSLSSSDPRRLPSETRTIAANAASASSPISTTLSHGPDARRSGPSGSPGRRPSAPRVSARTGRLMVGASDI